MKNKIPSTIIICLILIAICGFTKIASEYVDAKHMVCVYRKEMREDDSMMFHAFRVNDSLRSIFDTVIATNYRLQNESDAYHDLIIADQNIINLYKNNRIGVDKKTYDSIVIAFYKRNEIIINNHIK